jgi:cytochrome P450
MKRECKFSEYFVETNLFSKRSSVSITWGIYLLSQPRYAHIQRRLREEIRANLPSPSSGEEVHAELLDNLPYLDAVSKEIMRVWSPVTRSTRIPIHDTEICGVRIPKGTWVQAVPWALNRAKRLWGDDAREFNPDRWLVGENKANGGASSSMAFATFGTGARMCIGKGTSCCRLYKKLAYSNSRRICHWRE